MFGGGYHNDLGVSETFPDPPQFILNVENKMAPSDSFYDHQEPWWKASSDESAHPPPCCKSQDLFVV